MDIVTQASPEELFAFLEPIGTKNPFSGYQHDSVRDKDLPPKKHFKVFYPSAIESKNDHILLDVLFEKEPSSRCDLVPILTPFIEPEREVVVFVPTMNSLLGDKLTAFAPKTIGIPYYSEPSHIERKTDIVKQLFDVGALFDSATDLQEVAEVYETIHGKQLGYRDATFTMADTLNDTMTTGFQYSQLDLRGGTETPEGLE